ncbi:PREDICTED: transcription termination factor 3, mitochondrial [Rhagoletis zephyria]|uniref:transcription termination factor 3, mitochondrial n=1 Tax=Rhagoletis zephyria TaxID=28612 RepID=UPI0008119E5F|nr:PREDICTED: transcription termination factor 3, mitochondrial [Rhagoletis zephyria]
MLILGNLRLITKLSQNNAKKFIFVPQIVRELRNQPWQRPAVSASNDIDEQVNPPIRPAQTEPRDTTGITEVVNKYLKKELQQIENYQATNETSSSKSAAPSQHLPASDDDFVDEADSVAVGQAKKDYVPTFNLAAYVNKSPTLQQFIQLGVDLSSIERRKGLAKFVLGLDFEKNVKPYLYFLQDQGVPAAAFGEFLTKNPLIFKVDINDLQTRVNYLESKNFTAEQRQRIFTRNPYWLMFSTQRIDRRLGHFQKEFRLSGDDVRFLTSKQPRLITYSMEHIRKSSFCIREEMGFDKDEIKCLLLNKPRLWMMKSDDLIERFAYAHQTMQLSHDMLIQFPEVLTSREFRLRQRHEFLVTLGRAQYDPEKDLYVSPKDLVSGNDFQFVRQVAKSDLETYELFLKTR